MLHGARSNSSPEAGRSTCRRRRDLLLRQLSTLTLWHCGSDLASTSHFAGSKKLHVIIISHSLSAPLSLLLGKAFSSACFPHADCFTYLFIYLFLPGLCHIWKAKLAGGSRAWFAKTKSSLPSKKKTALLLVIHIY